VLVIKQVAERSASECGVCTVTGLQPQRRVHCHAASTWWYGFRLLEHDLGPEFHRHRPTFRCRRRGQSFSSLFWSCPGCDLISPLYRMVLLWVVRVVSLIMNAVTVGNVVKVKELCLVFACSFHWWMSWRAQCLSAVVFCCEYLKSLTMTPKKEWKFDCAIASFCFGLSASLETQLNTVRVNRCSFIA